MAVEKLDPPAPSDTDSGKGNRAVVVAIVTTAVAVIAYFALGMPGMDHGGDTPSGDHGAGHDQPAP